MAELNSNNSDGSPSGSQEGQQPPAQANNPPGPVPYERFKEVNEKLRALETQAAKAEEERKKAAEKELAEQNKWKELAEKREADLKYEQLNRLRLEIAMRKGLPVDLAGRLVGADEKELEADAEKLAQLMKPGTPGVPPAGRPPQPTMPTPEQLNDPDWVRKNVEKVWALARTGK